MKRTNTQAHYFRTPMQEALRGCPPTQLKPQPSDDPAHRAAVEAFLRRETARKNIEDFKEAIEAVGIRKMEEILSPSTLSALQCARDSYERGQPLGFTETFIESAQVRYGLPNNGADLFATLRYIAKR